MKRKLLIIFTLVCSFMLYINSVNADEKKACIYNKYKENNETLALVYDGKELKLFYGDGHSGYWHSKINAKIRFYEWTKKPDDLVSDKESTGMFGDGTRDVVNLEGYAKKMENFDECPQYISLVNSSINNSKKHLMAFINNDLSFPPASVIALTNDAYKIDENKIMAKPTNGADKDKYIPIYKLKNSDSNPDTIIKYSSDDSLKCSYQNDVDIVQEYYGHQEIYIDGSHNGDFDLDIDNLTECPHCIKRDDDNKYIYTKAATWNYEGDNLGQYCDYSSTFHRKEWYSSGATLHVTDPICYYTDTKDPTVNCRLLIHNNENAFSCDLRDDSEFNHETFYDPFNVYWLWFNYGIKNKCPERIYVDSNKHLKLKTPDEYYRIYESDEILDKKEEDIKEKEEQELEDLRKQREIQSCLILINDDIKEIIDNIMKYIRILVPILLLIYGTIDFFGAVFSDDVEKMNSKRKKFFKRIVAAIIVFIVPVFVNLLLDLANKVWANINKETCVNIDK